MKNKEEGNGFGRAGLRRNSFLRCKVRLSWYEAEPGGVNVTPPGSVYA